MSSITTIRQTSEEQQPLDESSAASALPWVELADLLKGALVTPDHPDWDAVRMPWTVNVDQQPAAVVHCADVDDVVTAVRWAGRHGISVTAQPSGHSARRTLDGALLLRTRALNGIHVDPERRVARVGAGTKFGELLAALDGTGLAPLVGSNPDPSVVGFTLGGGVSWFSRKHGFTANSVLSLDVVDADGRARRIDAESDPELFWALRGGGGDFAIVTAMELRLYAAHDLYGGRLLWPVDHAGAVLRAFRDLALMAPRGRSFVTVAALCLGGEHLGEALLWRLRESAPVELDVMGPVSIGGIGDIAEEPTDPMPIIEYRRRQCPAPSTPSTRRSAGAPRAAGCPTSAARASRTPPAATRTRSPGCGR